MAWKPPPTSSTRASSRDLRRGTRHGGGWADGETLHPPRGRRRDGTPGSGPRPEGRSAGGGDGRGRRVERRNRPCPRSAKGETNSRSPPEDPGRPLHGRSRARDGARIRGGEGPPDHGGPRGPSRRRNRGPRRRRDPGVHHPPRLGKPRAAALGSDGRASSGATSRRALQAPRIESGSAAIHEPPFLSPLPDGGVAAEARAQERRAPFVPRLSQAISVRRYNRRTRSHASRAAASRYVVGLRSLKNAWGAPGYIRISKSFLYSAIALTSLSRSALSRVSSAPYSPRTGPAMSRTRSIGDGFSP